MGYFCFPTHYSLYFYWYTFTIHNHLCSDALITYGAPHIYYNYLSISHNHFITWSKNVLFQCDGQRCICVYLHTTILFTHCKLLISLRGLIKFIYICICKLCVTWRNNHNIRAAFCTNHPFNKSCLWLLRLILWPYGQKYINIDKWVSRVIEFPTGFPIDYLKGIFSNVSRIWQKAKMPGQKKNNSFH